MPRTREEIRAANRIACAKWRKLNKEKHRETTLKLQYFYKNKGCCIQCGKKRNKSKIYCDYHLKMKVGQVRLKRYLKRNGLK